MITAEDKLLKDSAPWSKTELVVQGVLTPTLHSNRQFVLNVLRFA